MASVSRSRNAQRRANKDRKREQKAKARAVGQARVDTERARVARMDDQYEAVKSCGGLGRNI